MSHIRFLKVKIKSLTAESRIIRQEETRSRNELRNELRVHRVTAVRGETRCTQLAYGFLRGRSRTVIEPRAGTEPDWDRVKAMVKKYGSLERVAALEDWRGSDRAA